VIKTFRAGMNGPAIGHVVLVAACALLASCASPPVEPPGATEYRPAQRSALATRRDLSFVVARWHEGVQATTLLARQQGAGPPRPVARLLHGGEATDQHVAVQRLPEPWTGADRTEHEIATLEQLYALVLRQEPQARYCLGQGSRPCDAARDGVSHAQLLQALAALRKQAVGRAPAAVPWRVVEMQSAPTRSRDADIVGVRAMGPKGPLPDLAVYFNRAPHSICIARTGLDGVASCRLEDQHADGHQHDHATAVVATFPGEVRADRVLLPTTRVLPSLAGPLLPAFAQPIPFPGGRP
jgi:hypothetical protein